MADDPNALTLDDVDFEELCELSDAWSAELTGQEWEQRMVALAGEAEPGATGRAEVYALLASRLSQSDDDLDRADRAVDAAIADGGPCTLDPRATKVAILLDQAREQEALDLATSTMRDLASRTPSALWHLAEVLELAGHDRFAARVGTVGLRGLGLGRDARMETDEVLCLSGRYRVRRNLGLASDGFDRTFEEMSPEACAAVRRRVVEEGRA